MTNKKRKKRPLLLALFIVSGLFFSACGFAEGKLIRGDGNVIITTHEVDDFNNINIQGVFEVVLQPGEDLPVTLETDANLQELIKISVKNNTLYVGTTKKGIYRPTKIILNIPYSLLENITIGGACRLSSNTPVISHKLALSVSGAADIDLAIEATSLSTSVSGAANISLSGTANKHIVKLSGASNIRAEDLYTKKTTINLSGTGSAHVFASDQLDASLSGVGNINYFGNPRIKNIDKSGIGSIKAAG